MALRLHEDPALFREAVRFTAAHTDFAERLIEKDYFCSVLLQHLAAAEPALVFKGGTCLAKVHAGFYRLSEDLDFVIPVAADTPRAARRRLAVPLKRAVAALPATLAGFQVTQPLTGANSSTQYLAVVTYASLLRRQADTIKLELGLREPLLQAAKRLNAGSILLEPVSSQAMVAPVALRCITRPEAYAEKFRAALTRREVAIRDFYDLDYAAQRQGLLPAERSLVRLVRRKLAVPGNDPPDVSEARLTALRRQLDSHLRTVLREADFRAFDLDRAFALVAEMATRIAPRR
ncbi:MAG: nucleotidyl transferase AbiEii/AbiGii toxin family protein [bacterium]